MTLRKVVILESFTCYPKYIKVFENVPRRIVISNCGTPTEVSEFLDHHLKPVMQSGKSYIKDSGIFWKKERL